MVQAFMAMGGGELEAFRAYADVYPDDCLLLVDTVNTLESGIPNAIRTFEELRKKGHRPVGIRLDSGDLAYLTLKAAQALDAAGFSDTSIVLSNQLDELVIWQIVHQIREEGLKYGLDPDAVVKRLIFGVGTSLITSKGQAALDGVYKLTAINRNRQWLPAIKISESPGKTVNPGAKKIWRLYDKREKAIVDVVAKAEERLDEKSVVSLHHPLDFSVQRQLKREDLSRVEQIWVDLPHDGPGSPRCDTIEEMRRRKDVDLECLYDGVKRLVNPHLYHISLTRELWELKRQLVSQSQ